MDGEATAGWRTVFCVTPVDNLDIMTGRGSETRYPLLVWRAVIVDEEGTKFEETMQMKMSWLKYECFENGAAFRISGLGRYQTPINEEGQDDDTPIQFHTATEENRVELKLTNRVPWQTSMHRIHGTTSAARMVVVDFLFPSDNEKRNKDVVRLEVCVPRTTDSDKGKALKLAMDWGKKATAANRALRALEEALLGA